LHLIVFQRPARNTVYQRGALCGGRPAAGLVSTNPSLTVYGRIPAQGVRRPGASKTAASIFCQHGSFPCPSLSIRHSPAYQAVEKRDPRRCASSFVIGAYGLYASFLRIRAPCISSFLTSLLEMRFFNGLIRDCEDTRYRGCAEPEKDCEKRKSIEENQEDAASRYCLPDIGLLNVTPIPRGRAVSYRARRRPSHQERFHPSCKEDTALPGVQAASIRQGTYRCSGVPKGSR